MKIGELLNLYMNVNEITCEEMAEELCTTKSTISRLLNGKQIRADLVLALIDWLFNEEG